MSKFYIKPNPAPGREILVQIQKICAIDDAKRKQLEELVNEFSKTIHIPDNPENFIPRQKFAISYISRKVYGFSENINKLDPNNKNPKNIDFIYQFFCKIIVKHCKIISTPDLEKIEPEIFTASLKKVQEKIEMKLLKNLLLSAKEKESEEYKAKKEAKQDKIFELTEQLNQLKIELKKFVYASPERRLLGGYIWKDINNKSKFSTLGTVFEKTIERLNAIQDEHIYEAKLKAVLCLENLKKSVCKAKKLEELDLKDIDPNTNSEQGLLKNLLPAEMIHTFKEIKIKLDALFRDVLLRNELRQITENKEQELIALKNVHPPLKAIPIDPKIELPLDLNQPRDLIEVQAKADEVGEPLNKIKNELGEENKQEASNLPPIEKEQLPQPQLVELLEKKALDVPFEKKAISPQGNKIHLPQTPLIQPNAQKPQPSPLIDPLIEVQPRMSSPKKNSLSLLKKIMHG